MVSPFPKTSACSGHVLSPAHFCCCLTWRSENIALQNGFVTSISVCSITPTKMPWIFKFPSITHYKNANSLLYIFNSYFAASRETKRFLFLLVVLFVRENRGIKRTLWLFSSQRMASWLLLSWRYIWSYSTGILLFNRMACIIVLLRVHQLSFSCREARLCSWIE